MSGFLGGLGIPNGALPNFNASAWVHSTIETCTNWGSEFGTGFLARCSYCASPFTQMGWGQLALSTVLVAGGVMSAKAYVHKYHEIKEKKAEPIKPEEMRWKKANVCFSGAVAVGCIVGAVALPIIFNGVAA